jgi:hypothetical protein
MVNASDGLSCKHFLLSDREGQVRYACVGLATPKVVAVAEVGSRMEVEEQLNGTGQVTPPYPDE